FLLTALVVYIGAYFRALISIRRQNRAADIAAETTKSCYLGLYAINDEALNGLLSSTVIRNPIALRWRPKITLARLPIIPFQVFFNSLLAPVSDQFVWNRVSRRVQGNDSNSFVVLNAVSPKPHSSFVASRVPIQVEQRLVQEADEHAGHV